MKILILNKWEPTKENAVLDDIEMELFVILTLAGFSVISLSQLKKINWYFGKLTYDNTLFQILKNEAENISFIFTLDEDNITQNILEDIPFDCMCVDSLKKLPKKSGFRAAWEIAKDDMFMFFNKHGELLRKENY